MKKNSQDTLVELMFLFSALALGTSIAIYFRVNDIIEILNVP